MKKVLSLGMACVLTLALTTSCATRPQKISAAYVSPLQYSHLACEQIRQEIVRVNQRIAEVSGVQRSEANKDAVAMRSASYSSGRPCFSWRAAARKRNWLG